MRIFKLIFFISFLFHSVVAPAQLGRQEISVDFGKKIKGAGYHEMLGSQNGGVYTLQIKENSFLGLARNLEVCILRYYDQEMNLKNSEKIELRNELFPLSFEYALQLKDKLVLFSSGFNAQTGENIFFAQEVDPINLKPVKELREILRIPENIKSADFSFYASPDQSKVLLMFDKPAGLQEINNLSMYVMDENLNLKWHKATNLSIHNKSFAMEKSIIDNEGNVYLLSTRYAGKKKLKREGVPNYQYHLVSYKNSGKDINEYAIQLQHKFLSDIQIIINEEQDIIGGGFYAEKNSFHIQGSYFFTIDGKTNKLSSKSVKEFPAEFLNQDLPQHFTSSRNSSAIRLYDYRLSEILLRKDGSALLVGEQYFVTTKTKINQKRKTSVSTKTRYHYDYNDIILVNVKEDGEISWTDKITKKQHSVDDAGVFSSFALCMMEGSAYFIYNNFPDKENAKQFASHQVKNNEVVLVKVDKHGNKVKGNLPDFKEAGITLLPKNQINPQVGRQYFLGMKGKQNRLVKINIAGLDAYFADSKKF